MTNEEMLLKILEGQEKINKRIDEMDNRLDEIESKAKITRNAINYISDELKELITVLNETNVVEIKY